MLFGLLPSAITGPFDDIQMPIESEQIDWEGELGVVIGRTARNIARADAQSVIAGYIGINDISARDLQRKDVQWMRAKSFDTFKPMGPYLTTVDEIGLATDVRISVKVNGVQKQDESTAMMVFPVDYLIEYITAFCTLEPGDIISTGTPSASAWASGRRTSSSPATWSKPRLPALAGWSIACSPRVGQHTPAKGGERCLRRGWKRSHWSPAPRAASGAPRRSASSRKDGAPWRSSTAMPPCWPRSRRRSTRSAGARCRSSPISATSPAWSR